MEYLILGLLWLVQLLAVAIIFCLLAWVLRGLPGTRGWKVSVRRIFAFGLTVGLLSGLCAHSVLLYRETASGTLNGEQKAQIMKYSRGLYSSKLPLIPLCISVSRVGPGLQAEWTIHYFAWGTVEKSLDNDGLPSITKPLRS